MSMLPHLVLPLLLVAGPLEALHSQESMNRNVGIIEGRIIVSVHDDTGEDVLQGRMLNRYAIHDHQSQQVEPYRLSEKAVVYVDDVEEPPAGEGQTPHPQLNQYELMFRPLVLPVVAGTTVDFPNSDNLYHNVFSYSQPKEFDLGRYPTGHKKSVRFDKPGVVKVYRDIHSHMYATILVLKNPYFAVPDDDGAYSISGIPEGTHTVVCWYGRKIIGTKKVDIKSGSVVKIDFSH